MALWAYLDWERVQWGSPDGVHAVGSRGLKDSAQNRQCPSPCRPTGLVTKSVLFNVSFLKINDHCEKMVFLALEVSVSKKSQSRVRDHCRKYYLPPC